MVAMLGLIRTERTPASFSAFRACEPIDSVSGLFLVADVEKVY